MSYQVLARKWRPQRFDDVIGQPAVTRTLKNALTSGRLAQAFVFAGPRGVGKTTTARILARALNCAKGPRADPCGTCDACVEIAEGRDIDVLEIDAATHTGIDNVREVIISGLGILPVRDRYKVFIIDEVHQLSTPSFNALLKSIEEPPPHVVFMMATTELDKIPETVTSRSQIYEFRTITSKAIVDQLRRIVEAEGIAAGDESLQLIARDAEGSMRDAQSKLDQVVAFTGQTIAAEDVAIVLGLVGRDLLLDAVQAVADENAPAAFELAGRAVELGYDLRAVCRELARVVRDLLVLAVDPTRITDPEIAGEGERDRVKALAARFSREDLLRAFDLLARADVEIRSAAQPRYHLEMALLRWIHLRKLMPIEDLIAGVGSGTSGPSPRSASAGSTALGAGSGRTLRPSASSSLPLTSEGVSGSNRTSTRAAAKPDAVKAAVATGSNQTAPRPIARPEQPTDVASGLSRTSAASTGDLSLKDALLAHIQKSKVVFYNTVVAQAQKIEIVGDRITFLFSPAQRTLREMFDQNRAWLEALAEQVSGRKVAVAGEQVGASPAPSSAAATDQSAALRERALADAGVQALLEVFPAEIRDIEEI